jgi:glycosyltransferase involved in cell wall biosynthesis
MSRKVFLLFCTEDWFVCSHWLPHIEAAKDAGFEVHVVTRVQRHREAIEARGAAVVPLDLSRRSRNPFAELRVIAQLVGIYRRLAPELVLHIALKPVVYGTVAAAFSRPRGLVNYIAGLGWLFTTGTARGRLLRWPVARVLGMVLKRGQVIVENPNDQAQVERLGVPASRITRIPGAGVDMSEFAPVPEPAGVPVVILAARMLWAKGVGEFVAAAGRLKADGIAARFALVGIPDDENPSSVPLAQLEAWQREGVVEWWGRRDDMPKAFAECSIVSLPSFYGEGVPKVLIEAAAAGRPIVTTDTPGCRDIVADGDNGVLVPPQDVPALAAALRRLLADPELRALMGSRGRERAQRDFSVERVVEATLGVYRGALG